MILPGALYPANSLDPIAKEFLGQIELGGGTNFTLASTSLGLPKGTREIFLVVAWRQSVNRILSSASVNDIPVSLGNQANYSGAMGVRVAFAHVPDGENGVIKLGFNGAIMQGRVGIYRVTDRPVIGSGPTDFSSATVGAAGKSLIVPGMTVVEKGFILSCITDQYGVVQTGLAVNGHSSVLDYAGTRGCYASTPIRTTGSTGSVTWTWTNVSSALAASWAFS